MIRNSIFLVVLAIIACKNTTPPAEDSTTDISLSTGLFPEEAKNMTIYEVNIRQHTPEGTLDAFTEDIPRIKELGTDILWIMPVQPIGLKNRKMTETDLGSYYSISSYSEINPEFGSMEDFKELVAKAHELDMYVILDWVPNHTSWDHEWISEYPEFYAKDAEGNITYEADWTDIALLDHSNPELRSMMIDEMTYWVYETDIDGFRCDHAGHEIPMVFWEEAIPQLNRIKDLFWLAEWDDPKMHPLFHTTYNWGLKEVSNEIGKGEANARDLVEFLKEDIEKYGTAPYRMTFTTNHDENAWVGTVFERYGEGHQAMAVLMWTIQGIPMVYSGQEVGLNKRLKFFTKDSVDWSDPSNLAPFYASLIDLRKENEALWSGEYGGPMNYIETENDHVFAFTRSANGNEVQVVINLSSSDQSARLPSGFTSGFMPYFSDMSVEVNEGTVALDPWEYQVYIKD